MQTSILGFSKSLALGISLGVIALFFSGCALETTAKSLSGKSTNISAGGIGGSFATIDPASGTITPSVKFGSLSASALNHIPGDGTQVCIDLEKSFWNSEIGSTAVKINGVGAVSGTVAYSSGTTSVIFSDSK
jgi:hypothetical protein